MLARVLFSYFINYINLHTTVQVIYIDLFETSHPHLFPLTLFEILSSHLISYRDVEKPTIWLENGRSIGYSCVLGLIRSGTHRNWLCALAHALTHAHSHLAVFY